MGEMDLRWRGLKDGFLAIFDGIFHDERECSHA